MKRFVLIVGLLTLIFVTLLAQDSEWCWAESYGGDGVDFGRAVCSDDSGNTYITGYFSGTVTFGSQTLMSGGDTDIFVSKFDSSQNLVWTAQAGGTQHDEGSGINVDSSGDIYITGRFMDTVIFGNDQITSSGDADMYLAKIDPDGNWLWVQQGGGTGFDWATYTIGIDQNDNIIITGGYRDSATFGTTTFTTVDGSDDIFVASFDTDGNWQWVVNAAGTGWDYGCAIATLPDGSSFITGGFTDDLTIGTTDLSTFATPDIYVAKITSDGTWEWAVQAGDNTYFPDFGQAIGVDPAGNAYIGGYFMGTATFDTIELVSPGNPNSDIFVAKIDGSGNWQWATMAAGSGDDHINAVSVDSDGNTYTTGGFSTTATFGDLSVTSAGSYDVFGALIDTDGTWQWVERAGGAATDKGYGLGIDNNNNAYFTGQIQGTAEFESFSLHSNGEEDIFIAKFGSNISYDPPENVTVNPYTWLCTWVPPGGSIIFEDFEEYNVAEYLAVQSDHWTTWSNEPGGVEDAIISDEQALSGTKSVKVDAEANASDLVLIMNDYVEGAYEVEMNMYIPTGGHGYYNLQKSTTPGEEWAFQLDLPADGNAIVDAGSFGAANFTFNFDEWMEFIVMVDLNSDWAEFYYNGDLIIEYQWSLGTQGVEGLHTLGGMNVYANGTDALFYFDDLDVRPVVPVRDITGYNVYLDEIAVASDLIVYQYQLEELVAGQEYTAGVQAVYVDGVSEIAEYVFTAQSAPILPPSNLLAEIQDYNEVMLTWEEPSATRILLSYNIYKNSDLQGNVEAGTMEYLDAGLNSGDYEYYVTAVYDNGESDPSNIMEITVTLSVPQTFNAVSQGDNGNVMCTWSAPAVNRALTSYKVYRDDIEIGTAVGTFYMDMGVPTGTYVYHATAMYDDMYESAASNQSEVDHVDAGTNQIPLVTELTGNYPNPFNPVTNIRFALSHDDYVRIEIYNIKGEKVRTLADEYMTAAYYAMEWNGTDDDSRKVTSGVYFYKLKTGSYTSTRKMILMK